MCVRIRIYNISRVYNTLNEKLSGYLKGLTPQAGFAYSMKSIFTTPGKVTCSLNGSMKRIHKHFSIIVIQVFKSITLDRNTQCIGNLGLVW
jgi:hypothetical protein